MSSDHNETLAFIEDYRSFTTLWDVNHKDYTNKIKINDALNALAINYKMSVKEIKNKIKSQRSYFAKEHQKVTEKKSGVGLDDVYDCPWLACKSETFILDSITPSKTKETGAGQTKNTESENPRTFEDNNGVSTFLFH
jgi:LysM repeat protein